MAEEYLMWDLLHLENRVRQLERREERRAWRETNDPFELHDDVFTDLFRLPPDTVLELVDALRPRLRRLRPYGISPERQVLTALRFYAVGCYQGAIGEQWNLAVSQPTVSRCVAAVTNEINDILLRPWVKFPITAEDRQAAREKFRTARQPFIGTIGAIDCTYVNILAPQLHEEAYVNHSGNHSLNVQAICDPDLKILNINARYPGARHDAYIWANSSARRVMERQYIQGERKTWLIGDDGYGLEPWLMTPLKHEQPETPRFRYNEELCSARSCIERLFGVLKNEFRCLSAQRQLMYEPGLAGRIVNACAVLHNIRIHHQIQDIDFDPAEVEAHRLANMPNPENNDYNDFRQGRALATRIQNSFIAQQYGRL